MKYRLFMISPGPKFSLNEELYVRLYDDYEGMVITTSEDKAIVNRRELCGFSFRCGIFYEKYRLYSAISFIVFCLFVAIKERLKGVKYDVVVTYDPIKTGIIGALVAPILGAKFAPEVNGVYTSEAEYIDGAYSLSVRIKKLIIPKIMHFVIKRSDGVKLLFDSQLSPFSALLSEKKISRFANYVRVDKFSNLGEKKEVLFVGFPFYRKGVDILIQSFKEISPDFPEWSLKILGWYPDMTELSAAIDGHPKIIYHPPVLHSEMPTHVGLCGMLVLPSRSEAMGRILVESMAAGKPRIGSNVDGIPTVINDGVDGLLFESENIQDLADKMRMLMESGDLRRKLGAASARRAKLEFSTETYFENKLKFYRSLFE